MFQRHENTRPPSREYRIPSVTAGIFQFSKNILSRAMTSRFCSISPLMTVSISSPVEGSLSNRDLSTSAVKSGFSKALA